MKNLFIRLREFIVLPTHSRTLSLLAFLAILLAIPLTVFIAQQQQEIRQRAEESCPDQCYSTELWVGTPRLADGTCDNLHPQSVFTCPGEENTVTCGGQPYYCDGSWRAGVRPQPTEAPPPPTVAPTNPPEPQPTAVPTATLPPAQLQSCSAEGYNGFCANASGQFPPNQQVSCGAQDFRRAASGDSSCTNKNYPSCYICPLSSVPNPTQRVTQTPTPTPRSGGPTVTPTPRSGQPTATPTPIGSGPTPTGSGILGDINGDGHVNIQDYTILTSCYGSNINKPSCGTNKTKADLSNDGKVDGIDYNILIRNFGR